MTSAVETAIRGIVTTGITGVATINRVLRRSKTPNPYLTGIHQPLTTEYTEDALKVEGRIPAELNGVYLRNGPNPLKTTNHATHHWFTGDAMLHGVRLKDGKALWYRNRFVRTPFYENSVTLDEAIKFGLPPGGGNSQSNVSCVYHAGKLLTSGELGAAFQLDPRDLSTIGAHESFSSLSLQWRTTFRVLLADQLRDSERQEDLVRASGLRWTLVRPVSLDDAMEPSQVVVSSTGEVASMKVTRAQVAGVVADVLGADERVGQTLAVSA